MYILFILTCVHIIFTLLFRLNKSKLALLINKGCGFVVPITPPFIFTNEYYLHLHFN
ncbi:hypothetical protein FM106_07990 [Brachybacterium faecium]|nr:hypothetical protein FM106_07990 [Brachybacterium faecium]